MSPRPYNLGRRTAATEATREQILAAARTLLGGRGPPDEFSIEAVARKAGVARMTVYYQFHSQAGLLEALADDLAAKGGMQRLREAFLAAEPDVAVRRFVGTFVGFWNSERVLMRRLRAMGVLLPGLYRGVRDRDEWRQEGARHLLERIGVLGSSSREPERSEEVALFSSLTSFEMFDLLCDAERSPDRVADLLSNLLLERWQLGSSAVRRLPRSPRRWHATSANTPSSSSPDRRRRVGPDAD